LRVFFDTNVLVSAYIARGLCADLYELVSTEHEVLVSETVLKELQKALARRDAGEAQIEEAISLLREETVVPDIQEVFEAKQVRDPDDIPILSSAIAAGADVLVTGDADLLDIADSVKSIRIADPRRVWEMLRRE
jgi:uncharacterized protein